MAAVSIVVPVYNVEPYLRECMESIVRQTLQDLEIICVNDGSTDGSLKILQEYAEKDPRIKIIDQENGGYGKAMNRGIDSATGEYLGIVEPDDYVGLNMYEDLYAVAVRDDLDFVKADFYRFCSNREEEKETYTYTHLTREEGAYGKVFCPMERLSSFFYVMNTWSGIYRLSFLRENGIRHQETAGASFQDNGFWFQTFVYAKRAEIIDRPYYRVRRDNPYSSIHSTQKVYAVNAEYDYIKDLLMKKPEIWEQVKGIYWRKRYHNYDATLKRIDEAFIPEYREKISREMQWGYENREFTENDFSQQEWPRASAYMNNTPIDLRRNQQVMTPGEAQARAETQLIMNSASFRIGRMITYLPRKMRNLIRRQ